MKDTFIIRTEWADAILELDPLDQAQIFRNLFHFHNGEENLINLNNLTVKLVWKLIQPNLVRNIDNYDKRKETSSLNGKLGGRPKKEDKPDENNLNNLNQNLNNLTEPNESLNVIDSVIVSVPVSVNDNVYFKKVTNISFDEIWNLYDKKIGSIKKLQKKWEALSDEKRTLAKAHIIEYVKATPDKGFRANFETYLNQERWTNEILKPPPQIVQPQGYKPPTPTVERNEENNWGILDFQRRMMGEKDFQEAVEYYRNQSTLNKLSK
jgi:hypothetical protein